MILLKKILIAIILFLLTGLTVFSQEYDWNEHNEAMEQIDWGESIKGWLIFLGIIGIVYLLITNISKKK